MLLATALMLSGCTMPETTPHAGDGDGAHAGGETGSKTASAWSWSAGGYTTSDQSGSFQAPSGRAWFSVSAGGHGDAHLTIRDGAGKVVHDDDIGGSGGSSDNGQLTGAPGSWTVKVDLDQWSGGLTIDVQGH